MHRALWGVTFVVALLWPGRALYPFDGLPLNGVADAIAAMPNGQVPPDPKAPPAGGFFVAWDPVLHKAAWRIPFLSSGGALSTAGQLIFVGNASGKLFALNPADGTTLWESQMMPGVATPVTYELDGKQYIAVMSGQNKGKIFAFTLP